MVKIIKIKNRVLEGGLKNPTVKIHCYSYCFPLLKQG